MSTRRELLDEMAENNQEELLCADGFDEALLGVIRRCGQPPVVAYDREKCIQVLMDRDGMTREDAEDYFEFNTVGAWVGDQTPAFVEALEDPDGEMDPGSAFQIQCGLEPTYPVKPATDPATLPYLTDHIVHFALDALQEHRSRVLPALRARGLDRSVSPPALAVDWCSLSLRFRRRAGHSTAAARLLHQVPDSVLLIPCCEVQEDLYRRALMAAPAPEDRKRIILVRRDARDTMHRQFTFFQDAPLIIIDNAITLHNRDTYDGIAEAFSAVAPDAFYLLLG